MSTEHWHVLGAGALGSFLALLLRRAGLGGQLLHQHPTPGERTVHYEGTARVLPVTPAGHLSPGSVSRLLVTTKAGQIGDAIRLIDPALAPDAIVMTPTNGLGFEREPAIRALPGGLLRAVTTAGAYRDERGHVHGIATGSTRAGRPGDGAAAPPWFAAGPGRLPGWAWDSQIDGAIGRKFSINCVINPLTATLRCRNGELLRGDEPIAALRALCAECEPVLRDLGLWGDEALLAASCEVCRSTAANRSSMLQDVLAGRPTEIAFLNGALLELAGHRALPMNRRLVADILAAQGDVS